MLGEICSLDIRVIVRTIRSKGHENTSDLPKKKKKKIIKSENPMFISKVLQNIYT